jgi:hypothetical protein
MAIAAGAPLLIAAIVAFTVRRLLFTDPGQRATPRPPVLSRRIGQLPGIRAFRS